MSNEQLYVHFHPKGANDGKPWVVHTPDETFLVGHVEIKGAEMVRTTETPPRTPYRAPPGEGNPHISRFSLSLVGRAAVSQDGSFAVITHEGGPPPPSHLDVEHAEGEERRGGEGEEEKKGRKKTPKKKKREQQRREDEQRILDDASEEHRLRQTVEELELEVIALKQEVSRWRK
uniref:Uncharacterized protein n=1 Tax=Palpitomonas bilix TaxID=652834 RepID=A0A7S3DKX7_9EUKA|mmetsp:Transcript_4242/g.8422  ORF Transcript_4242/g.8422 Transcript_4242/m.8422 type:complete len:175 (+) Transcript_4242:183-707(+)